MNKNIFALLLFTCFSIICVPIDATEMEQLVDAVRLAKALTSPHLKQQIIKMCKSIISVLSEKESEKEIEHYNIEGETFLSSKVYTYDEKVDITVRRTTFTGSVVFEFHNDAGLTFDRTTVMGSIRIIGHGLLDIVLQRTTFMGPCNTYFYQGGSLNCQRSTFMERAEHYGKFQKYTERCTSM